MAGEPRVAPRAICAGGRPRDAPRARLISELKAAPRPRPEEPRAVDKIRPAAPPRCDIIFVGVVFEIPRVAPLQRIMQSVELNGLEIFLFNKSFLHTVGN